MPCTTLGSADIRVIMSNMMTAFIEFIASYKDVKVSGAIKL